MTAIPAALVKQLRQKTALPMMECKKALQEAEGDLAKAEDLLRKSGALAAQSKAGRQITEGRVACFIEPGGTAAGMVEIRCETAPVANTDDFVQMCSTICEHIVTCDATAQDVEQLLDQPLATDNAKTIQQLLHDCVAKIRENMQIIRFTKLRGSGYIASYVHHNGQVAVLAELDCPADLAGNQQLQDLGKDLCMQIAATQPVAVDRDGMPADMVEKEREVIRALVEQQAKNKPANIIEKILTGKLDKWFNQYVLLEQPFVKEDKQTVGQVIEQVSKSLGKDIKVVKFIRYQVGAQAKE